MYLPILLISPLSLLYLPRQEGYVFAKICVCPGARQRIFDFAIDTTCLDPGIFETCILSFQVANILSVKVKLNFIYSCDELCSLHLTHPLMPL